jgi:antitoxin component YwqK of YwqJK toxin-antitoxin module
MKKLILLLLFIPLLSCQNGEVKTYYESGELQATGNYVDGLEQGELKYYYKSGELEVTGNYVDGVKQ